MRKITLESKPIPIPYSQKSFYFGWLFLFFLVVSEYIKYIIIVSVWNPDFKLHDIDCYIYISAFWHTQMHWLHNTVIWILIKCCYTRVFWLIEKFGIMAELLKKKKKSHFQRNSGALMFLIAKTLNCWQNW